MKKFLYLLFAAFVAGNRNPGYAGKSGQPRQSQPRPYGQDADCVLQFHE